MLLISIFVAYGKKYLNKVYIWMIPIPGIVVASWAISTEDLPENVSKSILEIPIGHDVDDRIEGGIEISNPEQNGDYDVRTRTTGLSTDGDGEVPREEWQPTDQKGTHDDA